MKKRCLIFDLDGTLVDSRSGIIKSFSNAALEVFGHNIDIESLLIGPPVREMFNSMFSWSSKEETDEAVKVFRSHYDAIGWEGFDEYDNVGSTLSLLEQDSILCLATNKPLIPTMRILDKMNVSQLFSEICCYSEVFHSKSKMVSFLMEKFHVKTIVIGDTLEDFSAAKDNGAKFVFCEYGYGHISSGDLDDNCKISDFKQVLTKGDVC